MDVLRLRILTEKSALKFGDRDTKDLPISYHLSLKSYHFLAKIYYTLERISFTKEILNEIGVTEDMMISKPGKVSIKEWHENYKLKVYKTIDSRIDDVIKDDNGFTDLDKVKMGAKSRGNAYDKRKSNRFIKYTNTVFTSKSRLLNKNHGK